MVYNLTFNRKIHHPIETFMSKQNAVRFWSAYDTKFFRVNI